MGIPGQLATRVAQPVSNDNAPDHAVGDGGNASSTRYVMNGNLPPVSSAGPVPPKRTASEFAYGVDARLVLDPERISFPATQVGTSAFAPVTVHNPDTQPHTLEVAVPTIGDPFGDFAVEQSANEVLEPGASKQVKVKFQPSRALSDEQTFQLATDGGVGPTAVLHVDGSGKDQAGGEARVADQDYQRDLVEAAHTNDPLHGQRVNAERAVRSWADEAAKRNNKYGDWTRDNIDEFLGKTGGDVHFEGPSLVRKLVVKGLAKATSKALEVETENPIVGKIAEKIVDKAADYAFEKLIADEPEAPNPEETANDTAKQVTKESRKRGADVAAFRDQANAIVHDSESGALLRIAQAKTGAELDTWRRWGEAQQHDMPELKDLAKDRSLAEDLLVEWVKQRAATPTKAGHQTNSKAWDEVREDLAKSGKLPTVEVSDLFIHQCRYEWQRIGMDDGDVEAAIAVLDAKRKSLEDEARTSGIDARGIAGYVANTLGADGNAPLAAYFQRSASWKQTAAAFADQDANISPEVGGEEFFSRHFDLTCHLKLETKGAAVYVKAFWYSAQSGGRQSTDLLHVP